MSRSSLDAIRSLLKTTCPEVSTIYVNNVPDGFETPSFFVQMAPGSDGFIASSIIEEKRTWLIVYFTALDKAGNPNAFNQLDVSDKVMGALTNSPSIKAPDGTYYNVLDAECGPRDGDLYIRVQLESQRGRPQTEYENMNEVHYTQEEG